MIANMNKTNNGKAIIAAVVVLALALCVCAVAMPSEEVDGYDTTDVSEDGAVEVATASDFEQALKDHTVKKIILTDDIELTSKFSISRDVTITSAEGENFAITTPGCITITSNATFENVTLTAASAFSGKNIINFYKNVSGADPITLTLNGVVFDASLDGKMVYQDSFGNATKSNIVINNSDVDGIKLTYTKSAVNPTVSVVDSNGLSIDVVSDNGDDMLPLRFESL